MPDTYLQLGGYTFSGFGVPERINGGGTHRLQVHKMLGGARVVDALGADDDKISFRGRFRGATAMSDAMFMDSLRRAGAAVTLSYWNQTALVVVERFKFSFERFYEVPYELDCVVVSSPAQQPPAQAVTADSAVKSDIFQGAGAAAGNPACAAAFNSLPTSYAANGPIAGALSSAVGAIQGAVGQVQSTLGQIAQQADIALQPISQAMASVGISAGGGIGGLGVSLGAGGGGVSLGALVDPLSAAASLTNLAAIMSAGATAQLTLPFAARVGLNISAATGLHVSASASVGAQR